MRYYYCPILGFRFIEFRNPYDYLKRKDYASKKEKYNRGKATL